jgi:hypothetical protein
VAASAAECPSQPGQIPRRRIGPALPIRVIAVDMDEQASQRADVLVVVVDDFEERGRLAGPKELEIAARDLPAGDIGVAVEPEQDRLHRREPRVWHPVLEDPSDDRQQVEVAGVERGIVEGQAEPGDEQRPVEPPPVVRHEPRVVSDPARELCKHSRLIGVVRQQQLDLAEAAALPPAEADEERERAGRGRQPRRLGVEAQEGRVGRRQARKRRQPVPIDGQQRGRRLNPDECPGLCSHQLAIERRGESLRRGRRSPDPIRAVDNRPCAGADPEVREPALEPDRGHGRVSCVGTRTPPRSTSPSAGSCARFFGIGRAPPGPSAAPSARRGGAGEASALTDA